MRFILDNILLTHETMEWAKQTGQPFIFLKLDFSKAYDMVDWTFLFQALGLLSGFIKMTKILFRDAIVCVKVNKVRSPSFKLERRVKQGCLLLSYLFLITAELLNSMVAKGIEGERIKGITMPSGRNQQVIAQFVDDTSFTLLDKEVPMRNLFQTLNDFCVAFDLILNLMKSCSY